MKNAKGLWVLALVAVLISGVALGDTSFSWLVDENSLRDQDDNVISAGNATVISFASPDATIDLPAHPMATPFSESYGNDEFYAAMPNLDYFGQPGSYTTDFMAKSGNDFVGMYVYAIVLNLPYLDFTGLANIPVGTFYGVSAMSSGTLADTSGGAATPQSFDGGFVQTTWQVIPEPGTFAMMGLGVAAIRFARWRRRRKAA